MNNVERDSLLWASLQGFHNNTLLLFYANIGEFSLFYQKKSIDILQNPIWTKNILDKLKKSLNNDISDKLQIMESMQIIPIVLEDDFYPESIARSQCPPVVLYTMGKIDLLEKYLIGIVGARKHTDYGKRICERFVKELKDYDIATVSGMALGIDSISHKASIESSIPTIAILGNGIDTYYPKSNFSLWSRIRNTGLIISEYPPGEPPYPSRFPERNRIISSLSNILIVIEAKEKSGSLITARLAAESGKDVFAVPGNIDSIYSKGTNKLINDGAFPLIDFENFLLRISSFSKRNNKKNSPRVEDLGEDEKLVFKAILDGAQKIDLLSLHLPLDTPTILATLTMLEIKGYITGVDSDQIMISN